MSRHHKEQLARFKILPASIHGRKCKHKESRATRLHLAPATSSGLIKVFFPESLKRSTMTANNFKWDTLVYSEGETSEGGTTGRQQSALLNPILLCSVESSQSWMKQGQRQGKWMLWGNLCHHPSYHTRGGKNFLSHLQGPSRVPHVCVTAHTLRFYSSVTQSRVAFATYSSVSLDFKSWMYVCTAARQVKR